MMEDRSRLCTRAELLPRQSRRCREERLWSQGLPCSEGFRCMGAFLHRGQLAALEGRFVP